MSVLEIYLSCVAGVIISTVLPILRESLPKPKGGPSGVGGSLPRLWLISKPYLTLGAVSLLTGILLVAFAGDSLTDWRAAVLIGYSWDSTLQKIKG